MNYSYEKLSRNSNRVKIKRTWKFLPYFQNICYDKYIYMMAVVRRERVKVPQMEIKRKGLKFQEIFKFKIYLKD